MGWETPLVEEMEARFPAKEKVSYELASQGVGRQVEHVCVDGIAQVNGQCHVSIAGGQMYLAGCYGTKPLPDGDAKRPAQAELVAGGLRAQMFRALQNIEVILRACSSNLGDIAKLTVFVTATEDPEAAWNVVGEVCDEFFLARQCSQQCMRTHLGCAFLPLPDAMVQVEGLAVAQNWQKRTSSTSSAPQQGSGPKPPPGLALRHGGTGVAFSPPPGLAGPCPKLAGAQPQTIPPRTAPLPTAVPKGQKSLDSPGGAPDNPMGATPTLQEHKPDHVKGAAQDQGSVAGAGDNPFPSLKIGDKSKAKGGSKKNVPKFPPPAAPPQKPEEDTAANGSGEKASFEPPSRDPKQQTLAKDGKDSKPSPKDSPPLSNFKDAPEFKSAEVSQPENAPLVLPPNLRIWKLFNTDIPNLKLDMTENEWPENSAFRLRTDDPASALRTLRVLPSGILCSRIPDGDEGGPTWAQKAQGAPIPPKAPPGWSYTFDVAVLRTQYSFLNIGLVEWMMDPSAMQGSGIVEQEDDQVEVSLPDLLGCGPKEKLQESASLEANTTEPFNLAITMLGCKKGVKWYGKNLPNEPLFKDDIMPHSTLHFQVVYRRDQDPHRGATLSVRLLPSPICFKRRGTQLVTMRKPLFETQLPPRVEKESGPPEGSRMWVPAVTFATQGDEVALTWSSSEELLK